MRFYTVPAMFPFHGRKIELVIANPNKKNIMNRTVAVIKSNATDSEHSQSN